MTHVVMDIETVPDRDRWTPSDPEEFPPTWAHKVVCIGYLALDENGAPMASGTLTGQESDILARWSKRMTTRPTIVTYNGRTFDLPVIMQRSLACRVAQPWFFAERDYRYRFSERMHFDVCDVLSEHGAARISTLDAMAKLVGLPGKQGVAGSDVETLYLDGRINNIAAYCLDDVRQTAMLFLNMWVLRGSIDAAQLDEKTAAINAFLEPKSKAA